MLTEEDLAGLPEPLAAYIRRSGAVGEPRVTSLRAEFHGRIRSSPVQLDRFNLAMDVIDRVPRLQATSGAAREQLKNKLIEHQIYVRSRGEDMEEIQNWRWTPAPGPDIRTGDPTLNAPEG